MSLSTIIQQTQNKLKSLRECLSTYSQSRFFVYFLVGFSSFLILLLSSISISQLPKINTQYSLEQFFPTHHPLLVESRENRQIFQLQDRPSYLISLELFQTSQNWLHPEKMQKLRDLTKKISELESVKFTFSMATLEGAVAENDTLTVGPIYERMPASKWESFTVQNTLIMNQLLSSDFLSTIISVEPKDTNTTVLNRLTHSLKEIASQTIPEAKVRLGGIPAIQSELSVQLLDEFKIFAILSLVVFGLIFFVIFQGISSSLITIGTLIFVNLVVAGFLCYLKIPFSLLLSTLPIVVSVSAISILIHSMHRWAEMEKFDLPTSLSVIREMFKANFLGSLTTALGFLALSITPIPLISQYGWVVALCVMITWAITHIPLMGFMFLTRPKMRSWIPTKATWSSGLLKKAPALFALTLVFTVSAALMGTKANFSSRLFNDLPKNQGAREATEHIDESFGGAVPGDFVLHASSDGYWKNPENLARLDKSIEKIKPIAQVGSVISVKDFFEGKMPKTQEAMAEFLFLYSLSEINPLKNYLTEDGKNLRVYVRFHDAESIQIQKAEEQIMRILTSEFPDLRIAETGVAKSSHTINQEVAKNLISNFWHAIVIVGFFLIFIFRSVRWALVACLPNLIPPAALIGALAMMQTPIKPGISLIFSIALGLAFNNTVYLLTRLQQMMKESGNNKLPIRQALLQEGNPCLFETIVMFSGFSIFLASQFELNQTFGIYMLLSILAGGLGDLVFLPVMLKLFPKILTGGSFMPKTDQLARASLFVIAFLAGSLGFVSSTDAQTKVTTEVSEILKKAQKNLESKDDKAKVTMKIIEANGETKMRAMSLQTLRDENFHALIRIQSPADLKGTAFLAEIGKEKEDQWLYLPSTKQVRRVVGTKKNTGILGSELTVEDLNSTAIKSSSLKLVRQDANQVVIELTPQKGSSIYSKVVMTLSKDYLPQKTEYFEGSVIKKEVQFKDYKKIGPIYRAQLIEVKNLVSQRGTNIELSDIQVNSNLSKAEFSTNALKSN